MNKDERREKILSLLESSDNPVPANVLAGRFGVSRQVIVQDIAILRANGCGVTATNRGYVFSGKTQALRVFKCRHSFEEILDEGYLVIEAGGRIENIFVNHRIYGRISARLDLYNKTHVEELYRSLVSGASKPLMSVTDGYHYHTISADSEEILDKIESLLKARGFLIEI